jgi:acyl transferase domain-containing protein
VLGAAREGGTPLSVGSVKTNFGHLEAAAGIAGLIKLALSLSHEEIPPHLHLEHPSPHVEWDEMSLDIPTARTAWPRGERARIAGVSSFGFSGTNAHILLEEAPVCSRGAGDVSSSTHDSQLTVHESAAQRPLHLLPLSAKTPEALHELAGRFATRLDGTRTSRTTGSRDS